MKKAVVILLILIIALDSFGIIIGFSVIQRGIKHEAKLMLLSARSNEAFEIIKLPVSIINSSVFQRVEKGEFRLYGKLYDIAEEKQSGDSLIFKCINDEKEEHLLAQLSEYIRTNVTDFASDLQKVIKLLLKSLSFETIYSIGFENISPAKFVKACIRFIEIYYSIILEKASPPPREFK